MKEKKKIEIPLRVVIVAESKGDVYWIRDRIDDYSCYRIEWLRDCLDAQRRWVGITAPDTQEYLDWHQVTTYARQLKIRYHGKFDGSDAPDAIMVRNALRILAYQDDRPHVIVLLRDMDQYPERASGMRAALQSMRTDSLELPFLVVMACAQPEIEAWHLLAYDESIGETTQQQQQIQQHREELRRMVGFCPIENTDRLTAKSPTDPKDTKRILELVEQFLQNLQKDLQDFWRNLDDQKCELLKKRGQLNGMSHFIDDIEKHIVGSLQ